MHRIIDKNFFDLAKENQDLALIANGLLEPRYATGGIGAALVVRAALYFERAYDTSVRAAIAECFEQYVQAVPDKLTFVWNNGKAAQAITMAKPIAVLATLLTPEDRFDFDYVGGKEPTDASLYRFSVVGLRQRQEKAGNRGFNALSFSWPSANVLSNPDAFVKLFFDAASRLGAAHGHAGFAVNLSPTSVNQNESTEYLISRMLPGLDVGVPSDLATRQLQGKIKTVDWLTAIDQSMLDAVGGLSRLRSELPQEWFAIGDYGHGIVVRAGVIPDSGASDVDSQPPVVPPAYIVLDHALRMIRTNDLDALQHGSVSGEAATYNTAKSTTEWLRRYEVSDELLQSAQIAILQTPKLSENNEIFHRG